MLYPAELRGHRRSDRPIITQSASLRREAAAGLPLFLFRGDALPGQFAVFLAGLGLPRRRLEDHAVAIEADLAHLVAADARRVGGGVDPGDKARAIEAVVAAIGAVGPAGAGRQFGPAVAGHRHHPAVRAEHDATHAFAAIGDGQRVAVAVARRGGDEFPGTDDRWHGEPSLTFPGITPPSDIARRRRAT